MRPFDGPRRKLKRAKEHIEELNAVIGAFVASKPYRIPYKLNAEKTFYECRVEFSQRPPPRDIGVLVGEIVYQLRSMLDHIVFELSIPQIRKIGDREGQIKATRFPQFPIFTKRNERKFRDYMQFVDKRVWDTVERYQPYDRTHCPDPALHPLALLERLNNADKHRVINGVVGAFVILPNRPLDPSIQLNKGRYIDNGEIFALVPAHLDPQKHLRPNLSLKIVLPLNREGGGVWIVTVVTEIYQFIRDVLLPEFTDIATKLDSGKD